jgi:hypothetical protein
MPFRRNRLVAWIAAFAVLLQALWPLLSHARPKDPTLQVPLCSVDGALHVLEIRIGKSTPLDKRAAAHGEHCKLCVFGDGKTVLHAVVDSVVTSGVASDNVVKIESPFQEQLHLLSTHPRAPPAVS